MRKFIVILLSAIAPLTSCRTSQYTENTLVKTDTVFLQSVKTQLRDSIVYIHDSIFQTNEIYVTLDSTGNEIKRIEYHNKDHYSISSTATKDESTQNDSTKIVSKTDQKIVTKTITTNTLTLFQTIQIWIGRFFTILIIPLLIYYLIRIRFWDRIKP